MINRHSQTTTKGAVRPAAQRGHAAARPGGARPLILREADSAEQRPDALLVCQLICSQLRIRRVHDGPGGELPGMEDIAGSAERPGIIDVICVTLAWWSRCR